MSGPPEAGEARRWRPRAGVEVARLRAAMLQSMRRFFARRGVLEIDVPMLSAAAVSDPYIESLAATLADGTPVWLHTSPEYAMKRLLAAGFPDLYFAGRVFRDAEAGRRHRPEFTMVEWYRLGYDLEAMMAEAESFIGELLQEDPPGGEALRLSYREAFERYLGVDPLAADVEALARLALADDALRSGLAADRDAWLDLLLSTSIAPRFPTDRLTTLYHYPASQAALARLSVEDATAAERFEVFLGDVELANGYVELTDAAEQRRRFAADQESRRRQGLPQRPLDRRFLAALDAGLPDCAGVAVGFDRVLMQNAGVNDIRDVLHFPGEYRSDD